MKIKKITKLQEKFIQCDVTTETENFFVVTGEDLCLIHNSPSLVFGPDPATGNFFVGTKAVFSKNPKMLFTHEDIDETYGHAADLAEKLKIALDHLSKVNLDTVYQGDVMFTSSDLEVENVDGKRMLMFTPNTLTYGVPADSPLGKKIASAKFGISVHTKYTGSGSIHDLKANLGVSSKELPKSNQVVFLPTEIDDISGVVNLTRNEQKHIKEEFRNLITAYRKADREFIESLTVSPTNDTRLIRQLFAQWYNKEVKTGNSSHDPKRLLNSLLDFVHEKTHADADALKTERGKEKKLSALQHTIDYVEQNEDKFLEFLTIYTNIIKVKEILLQHLKHMDNGIKTLLKQQGNQFKVTSPEGFVVIKDRDSDNRMFIKLVDRFEFSRNNMLYGKFSQDT